MRLRDFQRDFNKNFGQNFNKVADFVEGFVTDLADQVNSPRTKQTLNSALDLVRPHFISLGLRISVLSSTKIELMLPCKARNLDERGELLQGVQISSAIEAFKLIWKRNAPEGEFQIVIRNVKTQFMKPANKDLHLRCELSELVRESCWAELAAQKFSHQTLDLKFFDDQEQVVSEVEVEADLYIKEMLEWK